MEKKNEQQAMVCNRLNEMGISYEIYHHEPVYTIEEMEQLSMPHLDCIVKNLFLRNANGKQHYLVVLAHDKTADLKAIRAQLGTSGLSFASEERLEKYLGLKKGAVTPFGVLNDPDGLVSVVFDADLKEYPLLGVHPNDNTATVFLSFADLLSVVEQNGNPIFYVTLEKA